MCWTFEAGMQSKDNTFIDFANSDTNIRIVHGLKSIVSDRGSDGGGFLLYSERFSAYVRVLINDEHY